jgi:hypothetical protein
MKPIESLREKLHQANKLGIIQELSIYPTRIFFSIDSINKSKIIEFCKYIKKAHKAKSHYSINFSKLYVYVVHE